MAVENSDLLPVLEDLIAERGISNCTIIGREKFDPSACTASTAFLVYVLHIIPQIELRESLLLELATIIGAAGKIVVVVPGSDSKYRNSTLKNAVQYRDGLAMLHDNGTYTFYKDFSPSELDKFLRGCGFQIEGVIGGDHKYIRILSPDPD